ncbi:MAG: DUF3987 domain-containing protein, partial [Thermogutta sp.]|nr:DUF3987 domain-containing protein [Thermogutta sp.]
MNQAVERLLAALENAGCDPRPAGENKWQARCPSHEDRRPSLSIGVGADGRVLLTCFAGCPVGRICDALGMKAADLFDDEKPRPGRKARTNGKPNGGNSKPKDGGKADNPNGDDRAFRTVAEAVDAVTRQFRRNADYQWQYVDRERRLVGLVLRWDTKDGKEIRPVSLHAQGWRLTALPKPRPLYNLGAILAASAETPIIVCEGEKACDAAAKCGLLATTSSGGACGVKLSDWQPVRGRNVIVLPDHDAAGEKYAEDVAKLCHAAGAANVRILRLSDFAPGLPEGGDLADIVESSDWCGLPLPKGATPKDVGRWILTTAEGNEPWAPEPPDERLVWKPYPVEALPKAFRDFVETTAEAFGCDESYVALPLLTAAGGAIGLTRKLEAKAGWRVPPILWGVIVGESGSLKTPAIKAALRWTERRQARLLAEHDKDRLRFEAELARYERDIAAWKRDKRADDPPQKPEPPTARRIVVSDTTVEALGPILRDNPRGVLLARDELSGWLSSFDRYVGTKGGDSAFWLSAHGGLSHTVDRKTSGAFYIPAAAVCVTGGIQPAVLRRVLADGNYFENGLASRLLMAFPPRRRKRWTESGVPQWAADDVERVFDKLFALQHDIALDGEPVPHVMRLSPEAKERY